MTIKEIAPVANEDVIQEFRDDAMGIPAILVNSVRRIEHGGESGVVVPDIPGLEAAMAVARVILPHKLNGREIRFLRRSLGLKAVTLASFLDVTPETLSRWENGPEAISTNAERVLRLRVLHTLKGRAPGVKASAGEILELKFLAVRLAHPVALIFKRVPVMKDDSINDMWIYCGEKVEHLPHPARMIA